MTDQPLPNVDVFTPTQSGAQKVALHDLLGEGNWVIVGVPGCFTSTCTRAHLPGFVAKASEFNNRGYRIAFMSVNDPFVLQAWLRDANVAQTFTAISDPELQLTDALGLRVDLSHIGLMMRTKRFCALVENLNMTALVVDEKKLEHTSAEAILARLSHS